MVVSSGGEGDKVLGGRDWEGREQGGVVRRGWGFVRRW